MICNFAFHAHSNYAATFNFGNIVPDAVQALGMDLLRLSPFTPHLAKEAIFAVSDNR